MPASIHHSQERPQHCSAGLHTRHNVPCSLLPALSNRDAGGVLRFLGRHVHGKRIVVDQVARIAVAVPEQVWSWGWNERGTLGLGHRMPVIKPQRLTALNGVRIQQVRTDGSVHLRLCMSAGATVYVAQGRLCTGCLRAGQPISESTVLKLRAMSGTVMFASSVCRCMRCVTRAVRVARHVSIVCML